MSMYTYGRVTPVRGVEVVDSRSSDRYRYHKPEIAIKEKMKVLREFGVVDDHNEETMLEKMKALIAENSDVNFDRVLDGFARKLIFEKLGG